MVSEHASPLAHLGGVDAGGQNVFVAQLALALARRGHEVTVYTRRDGEGLADRVAMAPGVTVEHVSAGPARPVPKDLLLPFMGRFGRELARSWRRRPPAVVHAHFWMSGLAALRAAAAFDVPVVQTFHALGVVKRRHQGDHDTSPPQRQAEEALILGAADGIVATCSDELFELVRLGANRRCVSVIPCGVDLKRFRPDGPAWPRGRRHRLVVVSRLVPRKGIGNAISALAGVPDCELLVAGGPPQEELDGLPEVRRFRRLAAAEGVDDRVHFLGGLEQERVAELVRSADVVACVPWYEPFGMVALEAMACGIPVIASAVGGLVDTVVDGVTGVHVPARRPEELTRALHDLLSRPRLRAVMGAAGAERARRRYGWDTIAGRTADLYARLAARRQEVMEGRR
jgi:glycosyltransferase involved in cell wall biosynthesis